MILTNIGHRFGHQSGLHESSGRDSTTFLYGIAFHVYVFVLFSNRWTHSTLTPIDQLGHLPPKQILFKNKNKNKNTCGQEIWSSSKSGLTHRMSIENLVQLRIWFRPSNFYGKSNLTRNQVRPIEFLSKIWPNAKSGLTPSFSVEELI